MRVFHRKSLYVRSSSCLLRSLAALVPMSFLISISFRWLTYVITCFSSTLYFVQKLLMVSRSFIILSECSSYRSLREIGQIESSGDSHLVSCLSISFDWHPWNAQDCLGLAQAVESLLFWADPSIVKTPRTETGTFLLWPSLDSLQASRQNSLKSSTRI